MRIGNIHNLFFRLNSYLNEWDLEHGITYYDRMCYYFLTLFNRKRLMYRYTYFELIKISKLYKQQTENNTDNGYKLDRSKM